jgi:hypothetical protein
MSCDLGNSLISRRRRKSLRRSAADSRNRIACDCADGKNSEFLHDGSMKEEEKSHTDRRQHNQHDTAKHARAHLGHQDFDRNRSPRSSTGVSGAKSSQRPSIVRTDMPPHTASFATCVPAAASASVPKKTLLDQSVPQEIRRDDQPRSTDNACSKSPQESRSTSSSAAFATFRPLHTLKNSTRHRSANTRRVPARSKPPEDTRSRQLPSPRPESPSTGTPSGPSSQFHREQTMRAKSFPRARAVSDTEQQGEVRQVRRAQAGRPSRHPRPQRRTPSKRSARREQEKNSLRPSQNHPPDEPPADCKSGSVSLRGSRMSFNCSSESSLCSRINSTTVLPVFTDSFARSAAFE